MARRWWLEHGNHHDGKAQEVVEYMPKSTKDDMLARALIYDLVLDDHNLAYDAYLELADHLDATDAFYVDKVQDYNDRYPDLSINLPPIEERKDPIANAFQYKSDPENVHDSAITNRTRESIKKLKENTHRSDKTYTDILAELGDTASSEFKRAMETPTYCSTFDCSDKDVFEMVWDRIQSKENEENKESLELAFKNAVKDTTQEGRLVCVNGRIARFVESLTLLDHDQEMGGAVSLQDIRNSALQDSQRLMTEEINRIDDKSELYEKIMNDVEDEETSEWKECVKTKIDDVLDNYKDLNETNRASTKELVVTALEL